MCDKWCLEWGICRIFAFNYTSGANKQSKYEEYVIFGGWATTAEDPTGYHSSPLQIGKRGYNLQELTKIGQLKTEKNRVSSLDFCWDIQMVRVRIWHKQNENMDSSCLVTTVQAAGGGVMVWGMFSWHTLGPLVPIGLPEHCFWPCPSLYGHHVPILWWLFPEG